MNGLTTFNIFLMGKGSNEWSSGSLAMNGLTYPGLQKVY